MISGISRRPILTLGGTFVLGTALASGTVTPPVDPPPPVDGMVGGVRTLAGPVPTLPATLRVKSETAYVQPHVLCGHAFAPGDVPTGRRVRVQTTAGVEIPCQQDFESRWPDGSLKWCELSFRALETFTAGQIISYVVDGVVGTPTRTPSYTLAALKAAKNFKVRASGYSWGANAGILSVNDVIDNGPVGLWGVNPTRGIEIIASGPVRQEWMFWAVARRESDGAMHDGVQFRCYVRRWAATGEFEIIPWQRQPTIYGPYPGATWTTTGWNQGNIGILEVFDGATRIAVLGGPDDRDARTVPPSAFDVARSRYIIPAGQNLGQVSGLGQGHDKAAWSGRGVAFMLMSNAPGGMTVNTPYYLGSATYGWADWQTAGNPTYSDFTINTKRNGIGGALVTMTSAPAGNVTVFPLVHSYPGSGVIGMDQNVDAFWVGTSARPRIRVGHDEMYLTRATRLVAPIDLSQARPAEPGSGHPYRPGQVLGQQIWDVGDGGDDWDKDRIGWLSRQHANLVLTPFDAVRRSHVMSLAMLQADIQWDFDDERCGRNVTANNGSNGAGAAYTGMAPPHPNVYFSYNNLDALTQTSPQSPGVKTFNNGNRGGSGYTPRYQLVNDGSHYPNWQLVPYLLTGNRLHFEILRSNVGSIWASPGAGDRQRILKPPQVPVQRKFWGVFFDQDRANGWARL